MPNATHIMEEAIGTFREREKVYGEKNYISLANVLVDMFPEGIALETHEDFARFYLFSMNLTKMMRYSLNLKKGGHADSVHDLGVYAFILEDFDRMAKGYPESNEGFEKADALAKSMKEEFERGRRVGFEEGQRNGASAETPHRSIPRHPKNPDPEPEIAKELDKVFEAADFDKPVDG